MKKFDFGKNYFDNKKKYFNNISDEEFNNPKWQLKNLINKQSRIAQLDNLTNNHFSDWFDTQFSITPYFWCLIDHSDRQNDPLAKQVIPDKNENIKNINLKIDPFNEQLKTPEKQLIKRYPDRALIVTTNICPAYCRYCTRKWNWNKGEVLNDHKLSLIVEYLKKEKTIREIIISGGEPLLLSPSRLEMILDAIYRVESIEVIRVATRILSFLPQQITNKYAKIFKKYRPIWMVTHFNHSNEITPATVESINRLLDSGVNLLNQSVLLKGVNDNFETMKRLLYDLTAIGIKPYYLFNCDLIEGTDHFRTTIDCGLEIIQKLRGNVGGLSIPNLIIDLPDGGKVDILPNYIVEKDNTHLTIKNWEGKLFQYPLHNR